MSLWFQIDQPGLKILLTDSPPPDHLFMLDASKSFLTLPLCQSSDYVVTLCNSAVWIVTIFLPSSHEISLLSFVSIVNVTVSQYGHCLSYTPTITLSIRYLIYTPCSHLLSLLVFTLRSIDHGIGPTQLSWSPDKPEIWIQAVHCTGRSVTTHVYYYSLNVVPWAS